MALYGRRFRYVPQSGKWLVWDGRRWTVDHEGRITEAAKLTARRLLDEAVQISDKQLREEALKWALRSESAASIKAMIELARSIRGVPVMPDQFDVDPMLLNVRNGVVDLVTGELHHHDPARLITKIVPVEFDPGAVAPTWRRFLEQMLPDPEVRAFMQRLMGYCLTGRVTEHKLPIAWGGGANGKTTFFEAMLNVLGDYGQEAPADLLTDDGDKHPTGVARLHGARLVVASETKGSSRLDEGLVKRLTGGDRIVARYMYRDFFEFDPTHKIVLLTNHKPEVRDNSNAMWRRLRVVPFTITIPETKQDKDLPEKLRAEAEGILAWAVQGCLAWQQHGLGEPIAVQLATTSYQAESDQVTGFLDECSTTDTQARVKASELYAAYLAWAEANGDEPLSQRDFGRALTERGFHRYRSGVHWWLGLTLATDSETAQERAS